MMIPSDETLIEVNKRLEKILRDYLPEGVDVAFGLPEEGALPDNPTVAVLLYAAQEDVASRNSALPPVDPRTKLPQPRPVYVRIAYLITYWESQRASGLGAADSTEMRICNYIINALINNRELPGQPAVKSRLLPPGEELGGLGEFWQAMGKKPRLCLNYWVTIPIEPREADTGPLVEERTVYVETMSTHAK